MSTDFLNILYQSVVPGKKGNVTCCLLAPEQTNPVNYSYILLCLYTDLAQGYNALEPLILNLTRTDFYKGAVFAFTSTSAGTSKPELEAFTNKLFTLIEPELQPSSTAMPSTLLSWFPDINQLQNQPAKTLHLKLAPVNGSHLPAIDTSKPLPLLNSGGEERYLSLDCSKAANSFLYHHDNKLALINAADSADFTLSFGTATAMPTNPALKLLPVKAGQPKYEFFVYSDIALSTAEGPVGTLNFNAEVLPGFSGFDTSVQFSYPTDLNTLKRCAYPLLSDSSEWNGKTLSSQFDPLNISVLNRSFFGFSQPFPFTSTFRTLLGNALTLEASSTGNTSKLVFYKTSDDYTYLSFTGDFTTQLKTAEKASAYSNNLLCGLSGTEYLQITPGSDIFRFVPAQPGGVEISEVNQTLQYSDLTATQYQTSWLRILNAGTNQQRQYYSEPNSQPFYESVENNASVLGYSPLTQNTLTLTNSGDDAANCFPIGVYAGVTFTQPNNQASLTEYLAFESKTLTQQRHSRIMKLCHTDPPPATGGYPIAQGNSAADGYYLTPQGNLASISDGNWYGLSFAQLDSQILGTAVSKDSSLPQTLLSSFLTNQQFIVYSINTGSNFGTPTLNLNLAGWDFELTPPDKQTVGNYHNVIIFKSANGCLLDWIKSPEKWTNYSAFNDEASDPKGNYISAWLIDYCQDAIQAYEGGNQAFENFYNLINDDTWAGFIALNVSIDMGDLSPELEPLLGGIDLSRFYAHHVGNEATRAQPVAASEDFELDSALFALIYYNDQSYNPSTGQITTNASSSSTYDFKVLTLTALFLKSGIASFNSKLMLNINELFSTSVLSHSSNTEYPATTYLLLDGSVQSHGSTTTYSFRTPTNSDNFFYLNGVGLSAVGINQAEFTIESTSGSASDPTGKAINSRFKFWGNLIFGQGAPLPSPNQSDYFDILSYERLAFSHLNLNMSFTLYEKDVNELKTYSTSPLSFNMELQGITISNQSTQVMTDKTKSFKGGTNYIRSGSLLAQFPLKLKSLVIADASSAKTPVDLGYADLTSPAIYKANLSGKPTSPWYGLEFQMQLGSMGALAPSVVFTADVLFAWSPQNGTLYTGMKLPGLGPPDKLIDIEGILTFGSKAITFDRVEVNANCDGKQVDTLAYVINFSSIGLHLLGLSFPAAGSTNVSVFGNPCSNDGTLPTTVGWFGSYIQPGVKPEPTPPSLVKGK